MMRASQSSRSRLHQSSASFSSPLSNEASDGRRKTRLLRKENSLFKRRKRKCSLRLPSAAALKTTICFALYCIITLQVSPLCDMSGLIKPVNGQQPGTNSSPKTMEPLTTSTPNPLLESSQHFREKPDPKVEVPEGNDILLRCEVNNQRGMAQWLKNGTPIFVNNGERFAPHDFQNLFVRGNASRGDHSIELRAASFSDTGLYECQVTAGNSPLDEELRAATNLTVVTLPPILTSSTSSSQDNKQQPPYEAGQQQQQQQYEQQASKANGANSQLAPRDISSSLTKLSTASSNLAQPLGQSGFITPHHHNYQQQPAMLGSTASSNSTANLIITFLPHLAFVLASVLFLINVYIIYKLIERKHRNKKQQFSTPPSQHHHQHHQDNSLESGSNGGSSASGSAGTGSSRLCANELSQCELEPSIEVPELHNHSFPINRICATLAHPVQQVWNGTEFVTIDSNGWVLEI